MLILCRPKSQHVAPDRKCKLHQNCTRIAPELRQNCTGIAPELQQNPSNCTQLQQNHIGVGGEVAIPIPILIIISNPNLMQIQPEANPGQSRSIQPNQRWMPKNRRGYAS